MGTHGWEAEKTLQCQAVDGREQVWMLSMAAPVVTGTWLTLFGAGMVPLALSSPPAALDPSSA